MTPTGSFNKQFAAETHGWRNLAFPDRWTRARRSRSFLTPSGFMSASSSFRALLRSTRVTKRNRWIAAERYDAFLPIDPVPHASEAPAVRCHKQIQAPLSPSLQGRHSSPAARNAVPVGGIASLGILRHGALILINHASQRARKTGCQ